MFALLSPGNLTDYPEPTNKKVPPGLSLPRQTVSAAISSFIFIFKLWVRHWLWSKHPQFRSVPSGQRCSSAPRAGAEPQHPPPALHQLRVGRGCTDTSWLCLQWKQDSSLVESNERLLLTLGQVLSKCFVRDNPVSISTYIKWEQFTVTKPIVFYLSNVYFRWYHQKAFFFFPLCENTFNQFLFLEERGKNAFWNPRSQLLIPLAVLRPR